jgi:hypothetical protein
MKSQSSCKLVFLILICLTATGTSKAQETQRIEISGGYSLLHDGSLLSRTVFNGWNGSSTVFLNRWFGVTGDVSGHYGSETEVVPPLPGTTAGKIRLSTSMYSFMLGPHFTYHRSRYAPFAQALFGGYRTERVVTTLVPLTCSLLPCSVATGGGGAVLGGFVMALGGGLDIELGHGISLRPVQAEYLLRRAVYRFPDNASIFSFVYYANTFRYSTGIVFRFGRHL